MMKERPIIFSTDMVKAILEGRKTQTRRVIKPQPTFFAEKELWKCPFGKIGDRLWVRETWTYKWDIPTYKFPSSDGITYKASKVIPLFPKKWKSPLFMPRWASRITLEITDIRVERLQEISEEDIYEEGVEIRHDKSTKLFPDIWNSLHKKQYRWEDNPWVWVISFRKEK